MFGKYSIDIYINVWYWRDIMQSNKYNDKLIIRENDSHSMILKQIEPNSIVLEFGCANGAMTQYMKETLDCKVYIVEYDKEAYQDAIQFAEDGICGDIMDFEWVHRFGIKFDYILFADVLEHLSDPKTVLSYTKELLKETGNVIVSVPNIAHNDIIRKLLLNHFDYTDIGLLDDTHIHFFAYQNLKLFTNQSGYYIKKIDYVYIPDWQTEQFRNKKEKIDKTIDNYLCLRDNGTVYQYIMTLSKKEDEEIDFFLNKAIIEKQKAKIYFNRGNGFSEEDICLIEVKSNEVGIYTIECIIDKSLLIDVQEIRIDPIEGQECIVVDFYIIQGNQSLDIQYVDGIDLKRGTLLNSDDPMMIIKTNGSKYDIKISCHFILRGELFTKELMEDTVNKKNSIEEYKSIIDNFNVQREEYVETISSIRNELADKKNQFQVVQTELNERHNKIAELENDLGDRQRQIIKLEGEVAEKNNQVLELTKKLQDKNEELFSVQLDRDETKRNYENVISTMSWKITAPLRKIYKKK